MIPPIGTFACFVAAFLLISDLILCQRIYFPIALMVHGDNMGHVFKMLTNIPGDG